VVITLLGEAKKQEKIEKPNIFRSYNLNQVRYGVEPTLFYASYKKKSAENGVIFHCNRGHAFRVIEIKKVVISVYYITCI